MTTAKDVGLMAANYIGSLTGLWGNFYQKGALDALSPEKQAEFVRKYNASLGIGKADLPSAEGIETYEQSRIQTSDDFSKIKAPDGQLISEKLNKSSDKADTIAVKNALLEALKLTEKTQTAGEAFTKGMEQVKNSIESPQIKCNFIYTARRLHELRENAHKAIQEQHVTEKQALTEQFANPEFRKNIQSSLGLNEPQTEKLKKDMLSALTKSQTSELAAFDKSMDEPLKKMYTAAQLERDRVAFFATQYQQKEMQKLIDDLYVKNKNDEKNKAGAGVVLKQDATTNSAYFKGLKVTDLPILRTITGRKITQENGQFTMELPNHILRSDYYHSSNDYVKADMMGIVGAVRACGEDSITVTIERTKQEDAEELARVAVECALATGFKLEDITVEVNGKAMTLKGGKGANLKELFSESPSRLQAAQEEAKNRASTRDDLNKELENDVGYDQYKRVLETGRAEETKRLDVDNNENPEEESENIVRPV